MEILKYKEFDYVVRYPNEFSVEKKYPLVIYLHGAGGRGRDIGKIAEHVFFKETEWALGDAVSIAPQCYADTWFNIFEQLQDFLEMVTKLDYVDSARVYLMGASMGGYGAWQMAMSRPELFAAVVPICGGGMYWNAARLKNMGVWAFHGTLDKSVFPEESQKMVDAINARGGNARLTMFEGVNHHSWIPTFHSEEMWKWLFEQRNSNIVENSREEYSDIAKFG